MYRLLWCFLLLFAVQSAHADGGPAFDLDGPRIDAKVTRARPDPAYRLRGHARSGRSTVEYILISPRKKERAIYWWSRFSAVRRTLHQDELVYQSGDLE